jgi:hypothetical protein
MGMEVFGKRPDARAGEYARYPTAHWTALIACVSELAPTETSACHDWLGNAEITAETSILLADQLDHCVLDGSVEHYIAQRNSYLTQHPRILCVLCLGTGSSCGASYCGACDGKGMKNTSRWYRDLYIDDVQDFIEFARHSGGFAVRDDMLGIPKEGLLVSDFGLLRDPKGRLLG